jgi:hypothetical protein
MPPKVNMPQTTHSSKGSGSPKITQMYNQPAGEKTKPPARKTGEGNSRKKKII